MKILVIDNVNFFDYPTGGIMSFYRSLLPAFGNDLALAGISTDNDTPIGKWTKKEIFNIKFNYFSLAHITPSSKRPYIPERISNCLHVKRYIKKIIRNCDFDVILTQTPEVTYFIPTKLLKKTCFILPGIENPLSISRYSWAKNLATIYDKFFLMPKARKVRWLLAAADYEARCKFSERSKGIIKAEDIIQFPTRFDDSIYFPKRNTAEHGNSTSKEKTFVTVGRLGWFKGWKLMIDAFCIAQEKEPNSKLIFIGDGEDEKKILNYINEKNLNDKIELVGKKHPAEIAEYLNKSDVFIMGSMVEGWSTTLVEACACGIPCVVTRFSSAEEMVKEGENGYIVKSRDEQEFAQRMLDALQLDRNHVIEIDQQFEKYAISHLKEDLLRVLENE